MEIKLYLLINRMIETLVAQLVACILTTGAFTPEPCVDILNEIIVAQEQIEKENCERDNCYGFTIGIKGFPYDSDANRVANYRYDQSHGNIDMITTFMAEAMFNKDAVGKAGERGICQLLPNRTNNKWINNERWSDIMYQAEVCVDKRLAVPNPSKIWYGRKVRNRYKDKIYYFN